MSEQPGKTTDILATHRQANNPGAKAEVSKQLFERTYSRLQRMAERMMAGSFGQLVRRGGYVDVAVNKAVTRLLPYMRSHTFKSSTHFYCVARREILRALLDEMRKRRRHPCIGLESRDVEDRSPGPPDELVWGEFFERIDRLDPKHRDALSLRYYDGLKTKEVARKLGVSTGMARRLLREARQTAARLLQDHAAARARGSETPPERSNRPDNEAGDARLQWANQGTAFPASIQQDAHQTPALEPASKIDNGMSLTEKAREVGPTPGVAGHSAEQPSASAWEPGMEPVPGYRLVQMRGAGGFGMVWEALTTSGVRVALKQVPLATRQGVAELKALDIIKHLPHAYLLPLHDYWQRDGSLIICTQLADRSIEDRLREANAQGRRGIPNSELFRYMGQIAEALDHLRHHGIQHCDVKPSNLLLIGKNAVLGDFGLARYVRASTTPMISMGHKKYMPPEFLEGKVSLYSDLYSFAVTYCELTGGRVPHPEGFSPKNQADLSMIPSDERRWIEASLEPDLSCRHRINCRHLLNKLSRLRRANEYHCDALEKKLVGHLKRNLSQQLGWASLARGLFDNYVAKCGNDVVVRILPKFSYRIPGPSVVELRFEGGVPGLPSHLIELLQEGFSDSSDKWPSIAHRRDVDFHKMAYDWVLAVLLGLPHTLSQSDLTGYLSEDIAIVRRALQTPIKVKAHQRRLANELNLDPHAEQREWVHLLENHLR